MAWLRVPDSAPRYHDIVVLYMQSALINKCSALYAKRLYYVVLYIMQSVLIM